VSPGWVFDHWVWEDDENTEKAVWEMIDGYEKLGIPVGAVVIDSPWATEYNNFVFNKKQYPDPEGMIRKLHSRGIRVIFWVTAMLNEQNPSGDFEPVTNEIYKEALGKGFLCNEGKPSKWWKGEGAFLDYTNPHAVEWWHGLMNKVLDMGADGWKVDGIDPMYPSGKPCASGPMTPSKYKDLYYMDMYEHTLTKNPKGVAWARAVDLLMTNPKGFAPISHSAVNWVGDEVHDWGGSGFLEALQDIFDSAKLGYTVVGSDTAGYHGDMPISKQILLRWAQFSAMCPLFENGGHGAHEPWLFDDETVRIYRSFVKLHLELKPYLYSMMMKSHLKTGPIIHPSPGKFQYRLGDNIFVSVLFTPENSRTVSFPKGRWRDFWSPEKVYEEGRSEDMDFPIDRYPIYIREGSIIPLYVTDSELGRGDDSFKGLVTLDITPGADASFSLFEEDKGSVEITLKMNGAKNFEISADSGKRGFMLRILSFAPPAKVTSNGVKLKDAAALKNLGKKEKVYFYDKAAKRLYVNPGKSETLKVSVAYK
ncbi:MAG TPA: glycoside hydrolase family 31 protein, partial [bacterium]|nr:glycoside hydrolase family 31 protein [bacterium]